MKTPYGRLRVYKDGMGYWWCLFDAAFPKRILLTSVAARWQTAKEYLDAYS